MSLKTAKGMTVGRKPTEAEKKRYRLDQGLKGAVGMTVGRKPTESEKKKYGGGLKRAKGMTVGQEPTSGDIIREARERGLTLEETREMALQKSAQAREVEARYNPASIRVTPVISQVIPQQYWGTSSEQYGQVSPTGIVEKTPAEIRESIGGGQRPMPLPVDLPVGPYRPEYLEELKAEQARAPLSQIDKTYSMLYRYSFLGPEREPRPSIYLPKPLMTPAEKTIRSQFVTSKVSYLESEATMAQLRGEVIKPTLFGIASFSLRVGEAIIDYPVMLAKGVWTLGQKESKAFAKYLWSGPFAHAKELYFGIKDMPQKYTSIREGIMIAGAEWGSAVIQRPGATLGRTTGLLLAPKIYAAGIGAGWQQIKKIGATYVPPEEVFAPEVLAGKQIFPTAGSPEEAMARFQAAQIGDDLLGTHVTVSPFDKATYVGAGARARIGLEDPGLYITPGGEGSPYFLGVADDYSEMTLNPFKGLTDRPAVIDIKYRGIEYLPEEIIQEPGFGGVTEYLESRAGEGVAFITKRSEIGMRGLPGLGAGTTEIEAVLPVGTRLEQIRPASLLGKLKGYSEYTVFRGKTIPIKTFEAAGGIMPAGEFIKTVEEISARSSELYSLATAPKYVTPYGPAVGVIAELAKPAVSEPRPPKEPAYSIVPQPKASLGPASYGPEQLGISQYMPALKPSMPSSYYRMPAEPSMYPVADVSRPARARPSRRMPVLGPEYRPPAYKPEYRAPILPRYAPSYGPPLRPSPIRPGVARAAPYYPRQMPKSFMPVPPAQFSLPKQRKIKPSKAKRKAKLVDFATLYVPSIRAEVFGIRGRKPSRMQIAAGLGIRPLLIGR